MPRNHSKFQVHIFYSYSHKDTQYKKAMDTILAQLKRDRLISAWSDASILPGTSITESIRARLSESDIVMFLLSPDFLGSDACRSEWESAKLLDSSSRIVFRVPVIVRHCPWQDFLDSDDVKALPVDGKPVASYDDPDRAWTEVYNGIKAIVNELQSMHTPKQDFLSEFRFADDLPTADSVLLEDIFVFPHLLMRVYSSSFETHSDQYINSTDELLRHGSALIHGDDKSGKTALAKHIYLSLIRDEDPVLFVDLSVVTGKLGNNTLQSLYEEQFHGDYELWKLKQDKTLIIDNATESPHLLDFIGDCGELFQRIFIFASTDIYMSYFSDEIELAHFNEVSLQPLTHVQQEQLIRKGLTTIDIGDTLTDGVIDQAEARVNSIIISNKIVPRYPFFVLAILQTYDSLLPVSISITSYGHCYYVLILASLRRAGIAHTDEAINSAFNFAEQLAYARYRTESLSAKAAFDFDDFIAAYKDDYLIQDSMINRLTDRKHGIISEAGAFKSSYMYYFFLGKVISTDRALAQAHLPDMCDNSYEQGNHLTLMFAIHHATDEEIVKEIQNRTMAELGEIDPAILSKDETARFSSIISELPASILSQDSVEQERERQRRYRDGADVAENETEGTAVESDTSQSSNLALGMLRVYRNNRILGQVLRNHYGKMTKGRVEEIIETISDSSLKLANILLKDEDEIQLMASLLKKRLPKADINEVRQLLRYCSFLWTISNIEFAVELANVPSIREQIQSVVDRNDTPAYRILGYFCELDNSVELTQDIRNHLERLIRDHDDDFIKLVLSIRTQDYMNTHRGKTSLEQSVCAVLGIKYLPRRSGIAAARAKRSAPQERE